MFAMPAASGSVEIAGQSPAIVDALREPLRQALSSRPGFYVVEIETIGRVGEVLLSVTSRRGRAPLIFAREELEPGYVARVVSDTVTRFGL